jgi:hypothetical protein
MSFRPSRLAAALLAVSLAGRAVSACDTCKQTPCVIAPQYTSVIEMVPVTVTKTKTTVDLVPVCTKTVMKTKIDTVYEVQTANVCKRVFETKFVDNPVTFCRPVCETSTESQTVRVCRPVTTTRCVTDYRVKLVAETVPVTPKCGHPADTCGCNKTTTRICTKRVPVTREVTETHYVSELQTQTVAVAHWRMVTEQRFEKVPVATCRTVNETVRFNVPKLVFRSVPETLVYKTAVVTCTEIPVTVYRPEMKMVPVIEPSGQLMPSSQAGETPSMQSAPDH